MRVAKCYLTKKIRRNIELKERIQKYGYKSLKHIPSHQKQELAEARREQLKNEKLQRKLAARELKRQKRAARKERKTQAK